MIGAIHPPIRLVAELTRLRDAYTGQHQDRVAAYAKIIAEAMGMSPEYVEHLHLMALAHDVGKMSIEDRVLRKPGRLTDAEILLIKGHTTSPTEIIEQVIADLGLHNYIYVHMLRSVVRSHHERMDGSGYPDGLKGAQIPLEARIVAVADVFDAITAFRIYRPIWSPSKARSYILRAGGKKFDSNVTKAFVASYAKILAKRHEMRNPEEAALRYD